MPVLILFLVGMMVGFISDRNGEHRTINQIASYCNSNGNFIVNGQGYTCTHISNK